MVSNRLPLPQFLKLRLATQSVAIGERVKKGTFRPCVETLPTSTLMGCFREHFGLIDVVAIGFFDRKTYQKKLFTYAPFDAAISTAKLPIILEYLAPKEGHREVTGEVYIADTKETHHIFADEQTQIVTLGALRSKGFGKCRLDFEAAVQPVRKVGYIRGNLRENDAPAFGIDLKRDLICPHYGYLFRPDADRIGGKYELALLIGTILEGPDFMIGEEYTYDR